MESDLKKKLTRFFKTIPNCKMISYSPYPFGEPGTPDKLGCINGMMILIELKAKGKKPSVRQKIRIKEWCDVGAFVYWTDNFNEAKEVIKDFTKYTESVKRVTVGNDSI